MAEEASVFQIAGLDKQLESLLSRYTSDELRADGKPLCSDFCKLVEEYASRWQVPLPQLRILEIALRYFTRASTFFTLNCDHVLNTLSSLALSVFELLLFFDPKDFHQEPLKRFTLTFQECYSSLARHQNVHLLQVERLVRGGGPWAGPALQAIISESSLPQSAVDECIDSELPVFFELRVRYLLSCERVSEALALAKCCAQHPTAGQHLFFLQVYLTWLLKTSQHDRLHKEVAEFNGKDAVHIICSLDCEETDELLLALSRAFLSQQLRRGDMYYLCDLVFIWSKLHSRLNTSQQALLEESHRLMLSATNVNSIFPFIRAILQELGEDGIQFCVELCAKALGSCRSCDVITKSLIYKTIAGLLPNDLEVSRACALLVFFLECTVETYKMVYLLYMHPDQEYHVEYSPIKNHIRFETLQVLKKDLYFDPEFWNLIALRTNCLKLMSEKVVGGSLEEIMEDKWILSYCTKESASRSCTSIWQKGSQSAEAKKRLHKQDSADAASKRLKVGPGKARLNVDHTVKKKGNRGRPAEPLRRSFWQLERLQDSGAVGRGELRRTTRLSEKNPPKRRIRTPKWLLEDSGTLGENNALSKIKKHGVRPQKHHGSSVVKRPEMGELKNNAKHKPSVNSHEIAWENHSRHRKEFLLDTPKPAAAPQVVLELSLPDNELMGTFADDICHRQRGIPQVLLYRPTLKVPAASQPLKTVHRKEVILRARDAVMFVQQLHCYARRQKGKGNGPNIQGSVSTITRSSVQGSPPKDPQRELCEKSAAEMKGGVTSQVETEGTKSPVSEEAHHAETVTAVSKTLSGGELSEKPPEKKTTDASQTSVATEIKEAPVLDKVLQAQTITSARELCEESAVEMKVTIASTAAKVTPDLEEVSKAVKGGVEVSQTVVNSQMVATDKVSNMADISNIGAADPMPSQTHDALRDCKQELKSLSPQGETDKTKAAAGKSISEVDVTVSPKLSEGHVPCESDINGGTVAANSPGQGSINGISALASATEMVTELAPEPLTSDLETVKQAAPEESTDGSKCKSSTTSSCSVAAAVQEEEERPETPEPESEESHLEFSCTFCTKVFKGRRVVAHAMFHYRKDECMFCGTIFKDDLLAMMHLSDHIEKLKRSKESAGNKAHEKMVSETKDISTPKPCAKDRNRNMSSQRCSRGRKSAKCPETTSLPESTPSGSRELRSNGRAMQEANVSEHLSMPPAVKVNGHIGKKKELHKLKKDMLNSEAKQPLPQQEISQERTKNRTERLQGNKDVKMDSSAASARVEKETESLQVLKSTTKQSRKDVEEKNVEPQGKLCCPVEGCGWFTDRSKTRVAFLYHAIEDHNGELKPLELAFRLGNNKCSSCMRVMWSFEHFQHHVERHRLTPRHPCLHQGCTARFKSGMEMRRHARRHSPLQAVCCLPGCSQLFICLWALNLHEREHYILKPPKPDKNTNEQTSDKHDDSSDRKKQLDHKPKDKTAATTVNKTLRVKGVRKWRKTREHVQAPHPAAVSASLLKEESKGRSETEDSHVLKNLSNKDTSTQPSGPLLRLRQRLRKAKNTATSHKVSLSLLKQNIKVRHKLKKKQVRVNKKGPKRRGRPPKVKVAESDENTSTGQNKQTVLEKTAQLAAETSNVTESKDKKSRQVQDVTADSLDKSQKLTSDKTKKLHKGRKRSAPKEDSSQTGSADCSRSKKHKAVNNQANTEVVKTKHPSVKEAEGKVKQENPDATQSDNPVSESLTVRAANTSREKTQTTQKRKLHKKKEEKKATPAAASDSGTTKKKHKDGNKKREKEKRLCKDASKASAVKNKSTSGDSKQVETEEATAAKSSPDEGGKAEESCGSSVPANTASGSDETSPAAAEETTPKETKKKPKVKKTSDPSKANKKPVKKICKDEGVPSAKSNPAALTDVKAGESPGYYVMTNGQAAKEDVQSPTIKEALAEYRNKPYMRPPPTAYLDEKYITMPKRRKELSIFQSWQRGTAPQKSCVTTAQPRQRCANCFATFDSAEELQSHLQLQKCSNLFGFDSDDEGTVLMS